MKILFEEFSDTIITLIAGLIIITIVIGSLYSTSINIEHFENKNEMNPVLEKIGEFECRDLFLDSVNDDLLLNVIALSNSGLDIKDNIKTRFIRDEDKTYVEYILKYNNDYKIKKVRCFIKEEQDEDDV